MSSIGLIANVLDTKTLYSIACFLRDKLLNTTFDKPQTAELIKSLADVMGSSDEEWPVCLIPNRYHYLY